MKRLFSQHIAKKTVQKPGGKEESRSGRAEGLYIKIHFLEF